MEPPCSRLQEEGEVHTAEDKLSLEGTRSTCYKFIDIFSIKLKADVA